MLQLNFSWYCPPGAFCDKTITPHVPIKLEGAEDWEALEYAEVGRPSPDSRLVCLLYTPVKDRRQAVQLKCDNSEITVAMSTAIPKERTKMYTVFLRRMLFFLVSPP